MTQTTVGAFLVRPFWVFSSMITCLHVGSLLASWTVLTLGTVCGIQQDMKFINRELTAKTFINILASDDPKVVDSQGGINMDLEVICLIKFRYFQL
jgi:hypothetical protein